MIVAVPPEDVTELPRTILPFPPEPSVTSLLAVITPEVVSAPPLVTEIVPLVAVSVFNLTDSVCESVTPILPVAAVTCRLVAFVVIAAVTPLLLINTVGAVIEVVVPPRAPV